MFVPELKLVLTVDNVVAKTRRLSYRAESKGASFYLGTSGAATPRLPHFDPPKDRFWSLCKT